MATRDLTVDEQDQLIAEAVERDEPRLRSFIRKRVLDLGDAEDVLQDVFYELTSAYRMMKPVEEVTAWLYRVARNRITDLFRQEEGGVAERAGRGRGGRAGAGGFAAFCRCGAGRDVCARRAAGGAG